MKCRRKDRNNPRVNLTPLIDTVFLLLIFFMMTTTFNKESQLSINLPEVNGEQISNKPQKPIRIIINPNGEYAINDIEHSLINSQLDTLERALAKLIKTQTDLPLLISADEQAPHYAVMRAMEAARNLGITRISFEAQQRIDEK
jgi:biopolymer transport protein ExbD